MARTRRIAPVWLMGLANANFGLFGGFVAISVPQLLAAQHVPEERIALASTIIFSPGVWSVLFAPVLDVRFSRRTYATFFSATAALLVGASIFAVATPAIFVAILTFGWAAVQLSNGALGGWLSTVVPPEQETKLSAWMQVANIAAGGILAILSTPIIRHLPTSGAAATLAVIIFLPSSIFLFIPAPGPDRMLARESFSGFFRAIVKLVRRREILIALALFLAPSACFSLTNILGGLGNDFHTPEHGVSLLGGIGVTIAGVVGSLFFPVLAKRFPLRTCYLGIGVAGAVFTLLLLLLPRTTPTFGLALLGENTFQSLAFTGVFAITFELIGEHNPLAATTFSFLGAASILPILYMQYVDGRAYASHGVLGALVTDASAGIFACVMLALMLTYLRKPKASAAAEDENKDAAMLLESH